MGETDPETDPRRRIPTALWLILGFILVAAFAAVIFLLFSHGPSHAFGPSAGTP